MEIIYILIPLSLLLVCVAIWGFFWAVKTGQFDDLDAPALMILDSDSKDEYECLEPSYKSHTLDKPK